MKTPPANSNQITLAGQNETPRVDSRVLADYLGRHHRSVFRIIERYSKQIRQHGQLRFEITVGERRQGGGKAQRYALLNEDQSYFLLTLMRNSDHVVELKSQLVKAFSEARKQAHHRHTEYLPTYHELHERVARLAGDSPNARFVHMNVNKLVNKTVGIDSGQRHALAWPKQSVLMVAQALAVQAMANAADHHEGYMQAKAAMARLNVALTVPDQNAIKQEATHAK